MKRQRIREATRRLRAAYSRYNTLAAADIEVVCDAAEKLIERVEMPYTVVVERVVTETYEITIDDVANGGEAIEEAEKSAESLIEVMNPAETTVAIRVKSASIPKSEI